MAKSPKGLIESSIANPPSILVGANSNSENGQYHASKAVSYGKGERYSSMPNIPGAYWYITVNKPILIGSYKFVEPDYGSGPYAAHQKSWFFSGYKNGIWVPIDQQLNRTEHQAAKYVGRYSVNNTGPFTGFKITTIESFSLYSPCLTFSEFDVFSPYHLTSQRKNGTKLTALIIPFIMSMSMLNE